MRAVLLILTVGLAGVCLAEPPAPDDAPDTGPVDLVIFDDLCSAFDAPRREELLRKVSSDIGVACGQIEGSQLTKDTEMILIAMIIGVQFKINKGEIVIILL